MSNQILSVSPFEEFGNLVKSEKQIMKKSRGDLGKEQTAALWPENERYSI